MKLSRRTALGAIIATGGAHSVVRKERTVWDMVLELAKEHKVILAPATFPLPGTDLTVTFSSGTYSEGA